MRFIYLFDFESISVIPVLGKQKEGLFAPHYCMPLPRRHSFLHKRPISSADPRLESWILGRKWLLHVTVRWRPYYASLARN